MCIRDRCGGVHGAEGCACVQHEVLRREGRQVILQTGGMICSTTRELASSRLFGQVVEWYVEDRRGRNSAVLGGLDVD